LAGDNTEYVESLYSRARDAIRVERLDEAEYLLREILRREPECAEAHFHIGRLCLTDGRVEDARTHLVAAKDFDGRPIRATGDINGNIRVLAATHQIRLLDGEASFEALAPDGLCGNTQFWDDCHPKLEGYVQLAELLGAHIADVAGIGDAPPM